MQTLTYYKHKNLNTIVCQPLLTHSNNAYYQYWHPLDCNFIWNQGQCICEQFFSLMLAYLQESMKLMGLKASVHWLSWFITFAVYLVPALAVYALLFGLNVAGDKGPVLANTDASLFFIFLLCYGVALLTFCFMVSTFVQKGECLFEKFFFFKMLAKSH